MKPSEDPHWCGYTRDLSLAPDLGEFYEWVQKEDKLGTYYEARRKNTDGMDLPKDITLDTRRQCAGTLGESSAAK